MSARPPRRRWLPLAPLLCALATASTWAAAPVAPTPVLGTPTHFDTLVGGVIVNGQASGQSVNLLSLANGRYAVALEPLASALQLRTLATQHGVVLVTPLGDATIADAQLKTEDGQRYVPIDVLAKAMAAQIAFDQEEFALQIRLPWTPGAETGAAPAAPPPVQPTPDIRAPMASLSSVHSEAYFNRIDGVDSFTTLTDLAGALGPGMWRTRILSASPGGRAAMQYYGWTWDHGDNRVYLGHDVVALDPLLPYANLTGAQYAWSNRPDISFGDNLANHELVASQSLGGVTLSGKDAPPGGIAELRIDGKPVARTSILLDGTWTFRHVALRSTEFAEVALYQRFGDSAPVRVVPVSSATSPRSLPAGTVVSYAGVGMNGNPLDPNVHTHGLGAFYQLRWGISDRVTLDTATQEIDGRNYSVGNAILGLGAIGTWSFGMAHSGNADAWSIQGNGQRGSWFWNGYALETQAGYYPGIDAAQSDRYGEFGVHVSPRLDLSLVARDANDPVTGSEYRFVKPAVSWRVTDNFNISARPDFNGSYDVMADWAPDRNTQVVVSRYAGLSQIDVSRALREGLRLDLTATHVPVLGTRYAQTLSGMTWGARPVTWSAGLLEGDGRVGYLLDAALQAVPGLSLHAQLFNDPINHGVAGGTTFQLSLVADFAVTPAGFSAGNYSAQLARRGAIAGRITGPLPADANVAELAGAEVLVDGKPRGTLDRSGHYFVGDLAPGVHAIAIDTDKLPIELTPVKRTLLVQVRAGATTHADLAMALRLGFAGRITDSRGQAMTNVQVVVLDRQGSVAATTRTGTLGYFRVDGLAPGTYTLHADGATRSVSLARGFVYGQDLSVSASRH